VAAARHSSVLVHEKNDRPPTAKLKRPRVHKGRSWGNVNDALSIARCRKHFIRVNTRRLRSQVQFVGDFANRGDRKFVNDFNRNDERAPFSPVKQYVFFFLRTFYVPYRNYATFRVKYYILTYYRYSFYVSHSVV